MSRFALYTGIRFTNEGKSLKKLIQGKDLNESKIYIKIQSVPRSKHFLSVIQISQLMLYREMTAVCSYIHTKHINSLFGAERRVVYKDSVRTAQ